MSLDTYKKKRDFKATPEPAATKTNKLSSFNFVVQRHQARRLHYDLRLEMDGVLKSWAIPKGPPMVAGDKRLAVMVEDHPVDYGEFYGEIPQGNYGAGIVEIWDKGKYASAVAGEPGEKHLLKRLEKGNLKILMWGTYLKGEFALVKMKDNEKNEWLMIKKADEYALAQWDPEDTKPVKPFTPQAEEPQVEVNDKKSKKTANPGPSASKEVADPKKSSPHKKTNKAEATDPKPESKKKSSGKSTTAKETFPSSNPKPMLATLSTKVVDDPQWLYETKYDGYRVLATINNSVVKLISRNGNLLNSKFDTITNALQQIKDSVILDGEVVIENSKGLNDFQMLQNYGTTRQGELHYYVFDMLYLNGHSIEELPLLERKELLDIFFKKYTIKNIFNAPYQKGGGRELFEDLSLKGFEGIIAKAPRSTYQQGRRSGSWLKVKAIKEQEAIICGFTSPQKGRKYFGSLLLGLYENGKLVYIGNCGTGFNDTSLRELHKKFSELIIPKSPFDPTPKMSYTQGKPTWIKPLLICDVKFTEWTDKGNMRHPVFLGLREDKNPEEIIKVEMDQQPAQEKQPENKTFTIEGKKVKCTNLNKIYWPEEGFTKGELINYYRSMSKYILPHLEERPQSLRRYPNGISGQSFFHKNMDVKHLPSWVKTVKVESKHNEGHIDYLICNDAATLVYMANLGCIEIHPWHSTWQKPNHPTYMMLDLDPDEVSFKDIVDVALVVRELCQEIDIPHYCKTSGSRGMHIYIPLGAKYTYTQVKNFAELMAWITHRRIPSITSIERSKAKRKKKIYIDFLQNRKAQTIAAPYSVRPRNMATVSAPLQWNEVNHNLSPSMFTMHNMLQRVEKIGDIWLPVLHGSIDLAKVLGKLEKLD